MLKLTGKGTAHTCDGISRRDFLQAGSLGAVGLSLAELTALQAQAYESIPTVQNRFGDDAGSQEWFFSTCTHKIALAKWGEILMSASRSQSGGQLRSS